MRNFLKQNLIAVIVCLFSFGGLSLATTIVRPYGPSDYAGGTKAVGSKVNAEFQNIVNFLNGGNIASGNIAASGVLTINIADDAVTTAKIPDGAITPAKLSASNIVISSVSTVYIHAGVVSAPVPDLTATITTHGRPVLLRLQSAKTTSVIGASPDAIIYSEDAAHGGSNLFFIRDAATIQANYINDNSSFLNYTACSTFSYVDHPATGTFVYSIAMSSLSTGTAILSGCQLVAEEIY